MPDPLRDFLLATGERGIGWRPVYGDAPLTVETYELLTWMQQRVALASTEEGRKTLAQDQRIERALSSLDGVDTRDGRDGRRDLPPPFDPEIMSPAEVADWLARYGSANARQ